ncbi:MAG: hypothetical protein KF819_41025 [Labilithrix sp.]|nr:hypothetical protein [Labilithrix sp.]
MNRLPDRLPLLRVSRLSLLYLAFVFGCEETDTKGWLVDRTRVLGVRFEAKADPARTAIAPGEAMRATWLVGAPNGTGRLTWAYAVCAPVQGNYPEPRCEGPVLASASGASEGELVAMELEAPRAEAVAGVEELQMLVAFCDAGDAALDASRFAGTCAGSDVPARLASATIRLEAAGPNKNPEIAPDSVLLDGQPMTPSTLRPGPSCAGEAAAPVVVPGSKHAFTIRFRGDEREPVPGSREGVESILASHVVTTGELGRQYSMLDPSDPVPKEARVEWTAPPREQVPEGGRLTEVYLVLRDGRGGAAFARRTVCVRP